MAWRPNAYLMSGELDNTVPGKVTGWMRFAGIKGKVTFELEGNFHRDIRGTRICFKGDAFRRTPKAKVYMAGFARHQTGTVGDMTAGYEPADYVAGRVYLEWYGKDNGRVVLELKQEQIEIIGQRLPPEISPPVSRQQQEQNMVQFLQQVAHKFSEGWRHKA